MPTVAGGPIQGHKGQAQGLTHSEGDKAQEAVLLQAEGDRCVTGPVPLAVGEGEPV